VPITRRAPRLVSGTKLYHHLFPELVVPVDRTYTGAFLLAYENNDFKSGSGEKDSFRVGFRCFSRIAVAIRPGLEQYLARHRAHTSITKLIDNAIMGFVRRGRRQLGWRV
jgi:hypothetical protein